MLMKTNSGSIIASGYVGKELEKKVINKNDKTHQIINGAMIVDKDKDGNSVWLNFYSWGSSLASIRKGDRILIAGKNETNTYTGKDGVEHSKERVSVDFFVIQPRSTTSTTQEPVETQKLELEPIDDDSLPF